MGKSLVASKTFWLNFISFIVVILAIPEFTALIPATWLPVIALVNAAGNMWLRMNGSVPITSILP